jgi:hypothetical protein
VIDAFLSNPKREKMIYFYCNRAEEDRREPRRILQTLIQQLAQTECTGDQLLRPVIDIYGKREQDGQLSSQLSLMESQNLVVQLTDVYPQTTICIDAVDEVDHGKRVQLLRSLKYVINHSKNLVKIFATTRIDPDILHQFQGDPKIELRSDDNFGDINQFINMRIESAINDGLLLHGDVRCELKFEICDALCQRSKGM